MKVFIFCLFILISAKSSHSNEIGQALVKILDHVTGETTNQIEENVGRFSNQPIDAPSTGGVPMVKVGDGTLSGIDLPEAHAFYSVPYGKVTTRFGYSTPADTHGDLDVSTIDQLACYQRKANCSKGRCLNNLSEDCLVLNIHVPTSVDLSDPLTPPSDRLPVLLWLHGGGFATGSGTSPLYDGRYLSDVTNTIVVSINYRLGAFGFLVYEENGETIVN
uniref:Carboxylesterase type B domain-containing protein n=1 Tax=Ciona intestinalis TaxID=7719 RepID=F6VV38_CIOIN